MTTIAGDGNLLACDSYASLSEEKHTLCKMHKVPGGIAAISGAYAHGLEIIEWLWKTDKDKDKHPYPKCSEEEDGGKGATVVVVTSKKTLLVYEWYSHLPLKFTSKYIALGSGSMAARAAMMCGKNAQESIIIASQIDKHTDSNVYVGDPTTQRIILF